MEFTSPSGLGVFEIKEPTRGELAAIHRAFQVVARADSLAARETLARLVVQASGVVIPEGMSVMDEINLLDEIHLHYFDLARGDAKKKP